MYSVGTKSLQAKENIFMAEQAKGAGDVIIRLFEVSDWLIVFRAWNLSHCVFLRGQFRLMRTSGDNTSVSAFVT